MATCADCRFGEFKDGHDYGRCRIRPPKAIEDGTFGGSSLFPRVSTHDWCGEHQPVKPDAAANLSLMADAMAPFVAMANAVAQETSELVFPSDLTDDEGEPLNLSSADFLRLADAYARATGA